jgi:hypothetical protein
MVNIFRTRLNIKCQKEFSINDLKIVGEDVFKRKNPVYQNFKKRFKNPPFLFADDNHNFLIVKPQLIIKTKDSSCLLNEMEESPIYLGTDWNGKFYANNQNYVFQVAINNYQPNSIQIYKTVKRKAVFAIQYQAITIVPFKAVLNYCLEKI